VMAMPFVIAILKQPCSRRQEDDRMIYQQSLMTNLVLINKSE